VLGAFFAGAFLIRTYGVFPTTLIATGVNAAICLIALTQPRRATHHNPSPEPLFPATSTLAFLAFPFVTGFIGLALEILWVRTLICVVSNNTYSFSVVLADVLAGLALGAWLHALGCPSRAPPLTKA